jgi:hypothetical protein
VRQKGFAHLILLLVIGVALVGGYFFYKSQYGIENLDSFIIPSITSEPNKTPIEISPIPPISEWTTYKSSPLGITVQYPKTLHFKHDPLYESEVLRFENDEGYLQIEKGCSEGLQPQAEDYVTIFNTKIPRYRLPKSGDYNQLYLHINKYPNNQEKLLCMYAIFGLKPDSESQTKDLFDQILSTFKFTN